MRSNVATLIPMSHVPAPSAVPRRTIPPQSLPDRPGAIKRDERDSEPTAPRGALPAAPAPIAPAPAAAPAAALAAPASEPRPPRRLESMAPLGASPESRRHECSASSGDEDLSRTVPLDAMRLAARQTERRGRPSARNAYAQEDIRPGDTIAGRYRVETVLSRGRGVVFAATHTGVDQRVVVRVLSPALVNPKAVDQFQREARILSRLESEHVARIFDFGTLRDGSLYLVREHVHGVSLAEHARRCGGLPLDEALFLWLQIAEAVQEAHSHDVVLRDLELDHVFLTSRRSGTAMAKLTDFGTCKLLTPEGGITEASCTRLFGLSHSAAPEVLRSSGVDARADVWSLGCVLYELLTGAAPFAGEGIQLMLAIAKAEYQPISQRRRDLPPIFDRIMAWALAKDRESRFTSVYAFAHELRPFANAHGQLIIDQIGQLACPGMRQSLAPPAAIALAGGGHEGAIRAAALPQKVSSDAHAMAPASSPASASDSSFDGPSSLPSLRPVAVPVAPASVPTAFTTSRRGPRFTTQSGIQERVALNARRRAAALVWAAMVAVPLLVVLLTIPLMRSDEALAASAQAGLAGSLQSDLDARLALAAMRPESAERSSAERDVSDEADESASTAEEPQADPNARVVGARDSAASQADKSRLQESTRQADDRRSKRDKRKDDDKRAARDESSSKKAKSGDDKDDAAKNGKGTLVAMAVGASCSFSVDGGGRGSGSSVRTSVSAGTHTVTCSRAGGTSRSRTVVVEPGKASVAVFKF
jgi:serine/threonine-protein kinase